MPCTDTDVWYAKQADASVKVSPCTRRTRTERAFAARGVMQRTPEPPLKLATTMSTPEILHKVTAGPQKDRGGDCGTLRAT